MKLPQAICPRCGDIYYGWVLVSPEHHICSKCGATLVVTEGDYPLYNGPFRLHNYLKDTSGDRAVQPRRSHHLS